MLLRIILLAKVAFNPPKNGSSSTLQSPENLLENPGTLQKTNDFVIQIIIIVLYFVIFNYEF